MNKIRTIFLHCFLLPIKFYKKCISPFLPPMCRYYPSCSQYALEAIETHGILYGLFLSSKRILKCNPLFKGGYDPVPVKKKNKNKKTP